MEAGRDKSRFIDCEGELPVGTHLHFLHHLLAEGADLGGAGDAHVLRALVLAGDAVEGRRVLRRAVIQVRLSEN